MKKILFIDLYFHNKTGSLDFILKELSLYAEIERYCEDENGLFEGSALPEFQREKYDIILYWQVSGSLERVKKAVKYDKLVFFPMYDAVPQLNLFHPGSVKYWRSFFDVEIICFCRRLHESLKKVHFDTHYFQYFPEPETAGKPGGEVRSLYFWRRGGRIDFNLIDAINSSYSLEYIHWHDAPDPQYQKIQPSIPPSLSNKIVRSEWYEDKSKMTKDLDSCAIYLASRPTEGIGMSFLEAMASGRCVVAPDHPTMNEYIQHNKTGILYDIDHPEFALSEPVIRQIQENAAAYIAEGSQQWKLQKQELISLILDSGSKYRGDFLQKLFFRAYFDLIAWLRQKYCDLRDFVRKRNGAAFRKSA